MLHPVCLATDGAGEVGAAPLRGAGDVGGEVLPALSCNTHTKPDQELTLVLRTALTSG
jgi:hypothetical protein